MDDRGSRSFEGLQLWSDALASLATPERRDQVVGALVEGDRAELENLLGSRIFQFGGCIDVVRTLTGIINFGPGHYVQHCQLVQAIRPFRPSQSIGRLYRFPDGTIDFVTEAAWWVYYDRAARDPDWRTENEALLVALGILIGCEPVWAPDEELVSISQTIPMCFPTVTNPYAIDKG